MKLSQNCTVWPVLNPGPHFYGPLTPVVGVPNPNIGIDIPGWFPISLLNFSPVGQGTMPAEAPLALRPPTGYVGEVWDLI